MRVFAVFFAFVVSLSVSFAGEKPDNRDDLEKLQGVWRGRAVEIKGLSAPPSSAYSMILRFDKNTFAIEQDGRITVRGTFVLDTAQKQKTIDLTIADTLQAVNKGAQVLGIYEIEKDWFRLCTTKANGQDRPKRLVSKPGTTHTLFAFQREKVKPTVSPAAK